MPSDIQAMAGGSAVPATPPPQTSAAADHGWSFRDVLSALNPLQYLPVVGTIYRAVTGDVIPEGLRTFGSMLVSGLLGGPIGFVASLATTVAEKATGIDPDKILTARLNPPPPAATPAQSPAALPAEAAAPSVLTPSALTPSALTPAQLAAYGVGRDTTGNLTLGMLQGADALNAIQLASLSKTAAAAYTANQPAAPAFAARPA